MFSSKGGVPLLGVVQIVLIVLKLCGLIGCSWPVVLIPLWIDIVLTLIVWFLCL